MLNLNGVKVLSKHAQKKISGGMAQAGTCAAESADGGTAISGVSKAEAQAYSANNGTHWCCDSCNSTLWYDVE